MLRMPAPTGAPPLVGTGRGENGRAHGLALPAIQTEVGLVPKQAEDQRDLFSGIPPKGFLLPGHPGGRPRLAPSDALTYEQRDHAGVLGGERCQIIRHAKETS